MILSSLCQAFAKHLTAFVKYFEILSTIFGFCQTFGGCQTFGECCQTFVGLCQTFVKRLTDFVKHFGILSNIWSAVKHL